MAERGSELSMCKGFYLRPESILKTASKGKIVLHYPQVSELIFAPF